MTSVSSRGPLRKPTVPVIRSSPRAVSVINVPVPLVPVWLSMWKRPLTPAAISG